MIPKHLWRNPTRAAIDALALRFDLPNTPDMQDWEWEIADAGRIDAFMAAYQSGELDEDERFTLMETIIQSFEDLGDALPSDGRWPRVLDLLDANIRLHASTVWYWAVSDATSAEEQWSVTPSVRGILDKHRANLLASGYRGMT